MSGLITAITWFTLLTIIYFVINYWFLIKYHLTNTPLLNYINRCERNINHLRAYFFSLRALLGFYVVIAYIIFKNKKFK